MGFQVLVVVMRGLVTGIHVFFLQHGIRDVDDRDKPG
jgi:hypothetical protein